VVGTAEASARLDAGSLSKQIAGRVVAEVTQPAPGSIAIHFADGATLTVQQRGEGIGVGLSKVEGSGRQAPSGPQPTRRQVEYLEFIKKYMHRYGVAPAETDIQAHFLVSAPSVNQMVRTLERRGFISRSRDWFGRTVPRSIRVTGDG